MKVGLLIIAYCHRESDSSSHWPLVHDLYDVSQVVVILGEVLQGISHSRRTDARTRICHNVNLEIAGD